MIFKKITFRNYKTFYGLQEIDLSMSNSGNETKNIILIGGLNGSGKTTFLKAILYILFGKRGISTNLDTSQREIEYTKIFSNVINDTYFDEGGRDCSINLVVLHDNGDEWELGVKWYVNSNKKVSHEERELKIKANGERHVKKLNITNIDTYNQFIDRHLPFHAAPFFVFDGEEIKSLIEKQNTPEMKKAIQKIAGIQSNENLLKDLKNLRDKLYRQYTQASNSPKLSKLQEELDEVNAKIEKLSNSSKIAARRISAVKDEINVLRSEIRKKLLNNSQSREEITKKIGNLEQKINAGKSDLAKLFASNAVQIVLADQIKDLKNRLHKERKHKQAVITQENRLKPLKEFKEKIIEIKVNPELTSNQKEQFAIQLEKIWMEENNFKNQPIESLSYLHDLNEQNYNFLINLENSSILTIKNNINLINKYENELEEVEVKLKNAPSAVNTQKEEEIIQEKENVVGVEEYKQLMRLKRISEANSVKTNLENQISRNKVSSTNFKQIKEELDYVDNLIIAIQDYELEYTNLKANIIKTEFEFMLKNLFRKQDEFGKIEFDTDSFSIRLYNSKMQEISLQDRSAGEMQMISSSLIWALTKASNLKLPVVIDTPLGRLDSVHRLHLIENYYKALSDQVIILSTDTEITNEYIETMNRYSNKQFLLDYDEEKKYTIIRDGYFKFMRRGNKNG